MTTLNQWIRTLISSFLLIWFYWIYGENMRLLFHIIGLVPLDFLVATIGSQPLDFHFQSSLFDNGTDSSNLPALVPRESAASSSSASGAEVPFFSQSQEVIWAELDRPLLPDQKRLNEIKWQLLPYFDFPTEECHESFEIIARSQFLVEKDFERALLYKGYTAESLFSNRTNLRSYIFYPEGKVLSVEEYSLFRAQIRADLQTSFPYRVLKRELQAASFFLDRGTFPYYRIPDSP